MASGYDDEKEVMSKECSRSLSEECSRSMSEECSKSLSTPVNKCDQCLDDDLEKMETNDKKEQAFVVQRNVQSQMKSLEETLKSVKDDNEITNYRFVPTPPYTMSGLFGTLCELGYKRTPVKLEEINVKTSSDTNDCDITGIDRLGGNRLAIANYNNKELKLIDLTNKLVTTEIKLDVNPWDLTKINDKNLAVTTFDNRKILLASITDKISVDRNFDISNHEYCQGIVYGNGSLIVSYHGPEQIETLDLHGTVKQTIDNKDRQGTVTFSDVEYIAKGSDTDTLYLSDRLSNKVHRMSRDGTILSSFSHQYLRYPTGISVGKDGRIFVCGRDTHKIYELSSDLSKGEIILDEQHGIKLPHSIVYDDEAYKLYIGSQNSNNIQVFMV